MSLQGKVQDLITTKRYKHVLSDRLLSVLVFNVLLANILIVVMMSNFNQQGEVVYDRSTIEHGVDSQYAHQHR